MFNIIGGEDAVDFAYFRGLHTEVTEKFTQLCQEWEEKSNMFEEGYGNGGTAEEEINVEDGRWMKMRVCKLN